MTSARSLCGALVLQAMGLAACSAEDPGGIPPNDGEASSRAAARAARPEARALVNRLRALRVALPTVEARPDHPAPGAQPVLAPAPLSRVTHEDGWLVPIVDASAARGVVHPTDVRLSARGDAMFHVEDRATKLALDVRSSRAGGSDAELVDGYIVYLGRSAGEPDLLHRITAEGTEDFAWFHEPPSRAELVYDITPGEGVAGLRLVSSTLEFLDGSGAPRLRVAPPYVVDANGAVHPARVEVSGCAVDTDPRAPWGRLVTPPGAASCVVRVSWGPITYPAVVDPQWISAGDMATQRYYHTSSVVPGGRVLIAGGGSPLGTQASAELYDPGTGTWSATGSMAEARYIHTASALLDGRILMAGGGKTPSGILASAELYDAATGTFGPTGGLATARDYHVAAALLDGRVLVAGGSTGAGTSTASAELYDPVTNTWSPAAGMVTACYSRAAAVLLDGKVLVSGGTHLNASFGLIGAELYDPATNAWSAAGNMTISRYAHTATLLPNGKVLVAGSPYVLQKPSELYDPATNTWSTTGSLLQNRVGHFAGLLAGGQVLVAAGSNAGAPILSSELYDPANGLWAAAGNLPTPHSAAAGSVLTNGAQVLVSGGLDANNLQTAKSDIYGLFANGTTCGPGSPVTASLCASGLCVDGVCCDTACSAGACDACSVAAGADQNGICKALTGPACDDGDACTTIDTCQLGICTGSNPLTCAPSDACHDAGTCDPVTGICSNPAKAEGAPCPGGVCSSGSCVALGTSSATTGSGGGGGGASSGNGGNGGSSVTSSGNGGNGGSSVASSGNGGSSVASSGNGGSSVASSGMGGSGGASSSSSPNASSSGGPMTGGGEGGAGADVQAAGGCGFATRGSRESGWTLLGLGALLLSRRRRRSSCVSSQCATITRFPAGLANASRARMSAYLPLAQPIGIGSGGPHTAQVSLTVFGLLLLLVLLASSELGYRVGSRGSRLPDQARISQNLTWQAGVLGLLGLLVGFSFAMAVSRFDARRELILEEANAIGTTYLRTHLIDPRAGEELRGLLRRYVHVRVAFYEAGTDRGRIEQSQRSSSALQEEIWSRVAAIGRADRHDVMTSLLVQATNDSFDLEAKRRTALENHVPITVFVVLVLVASTAMASIGFTCGLTGRRFWFGMLFMPLLIAAVVFLVFDIDRPRTGLIRAGEQSMIRLEQSL